MVVVKSRALGFIDYGFVQAGLLNFVLLFPNAAILYGAYQARQGKSYGWALAAAVLACTPCVSLPFTCFAMGLGLWMLALLWRDDVRACFSAIPTDQE